MHINCVFDFHQNAYVKEWIVKFEEWIREKDLDSNSFILKLETSPFSPIGLRLSISYYFKQGVDEGTIKQTREIDKSGGLEFWKAFVDNEISFFKIMVEDKLLWLERRKNDL